MLEVCSLIKSGGYDLYLLFKQMIFVKLIFNFSSTPTQIFVIFGSQSYMKAFSSLVKSSCVTYIFN